MDLPRFKSKIESMSISTYTSQFNIFWKWKINIESHSSAHILDKYHLEETAKRLLDILPGWQTYRGTDCDYRQYLPQALVNISDDYDLLRQYDIFDIDLISNDSLNRVWHELGRVKESCGKRDAEGRYFIIAICKPLMLLWGQTPALDSKNRKNMKKDPDIVSSCKIPTNRWSFEAWRGILIHLKNELQTHQDIMNYCRAKSKELFNLDAQIPFGRFIDSYYFDKKQTMCQSS